MVGMELVLRNIKMFSPQPGSLLVIVLAVFISNTRSKF